MKLHYLFINRHNGHEITYHPFSSNTLLSQERVTSLLETIPGANRSGTCVEHLLALLHKEYIEFDVFECPCCEKIIHQLTDPNLDLIKTIWGIEFILLEGVDGNY